MTKVKYNVKPTLISSMEKEAAINRSFGDQGNSPIKLLSSKFKLQLNSKPGSPPKKKKSYYKRITTSLRNTRKNIGKTLSTIFSNKPDVKNTLRLSPDTGGKRKQVLKRKMTMRRKKR